MANYNNYQSFAWQLRRLLIMQRDGFRCTKCKLPSTHLTVHHKKYQKGRDVWNYTDEYLTTVCNGCHIKIHAAQSIDSFYNKTEQELPEYQFPRHILDAFGVPEVKKSEPKAKKVKKPKKQKEEPYHKVRLREIKAMYGGI